ncbi:flagellar hook-associated protein 3 FlgL [Paenibacillaceae bacterium GAS479]|nr:flagellar hook-associated protein 3 FlgL [Paenibacillaceae bacterium GAS479]
MRVTNNMLSSQLLLNLNRNTGRMAELQNQLSTGRQINKPSDNPVGITYALRYRSELAYNEQYQKNVDSAVSWLDFNDTVLNQAGDIMQRLRELTVQASNGSNPQSALDSIREEVLQLQGQLIDVANSKLNGKYVFNGQQYDKKPYDMPPNADGTVNTTLAAAIETDNGTVDYVVGEDIQLPVNISGNTVFGTPGASDNLFAVMGRITSALQSGNYGALSNELASIDSRQEGLLKIRAESGARSNRIDLMQNRLADLGINLTELQSKTEDADYAGLLMKSKIQENIYNASLSVGAKIISPSLMDFLR